MDQEYNFQDLVGCHICDTTPSLHCDLCHEHLCNDCEVDHIANKSNDHNMVPLKRRRYIFVLPECPRHSKKKLVNGIVNNVTLHFVHIVFPLISIQTTKTLTFWKVQKKRKNTLRAIYKKLQLQFLPDINRLLAVSSTKQLICM